MPGLLAALNEGGNYDLALANGGDLQVFAVPNSIPSAASVLIFVPNFATLRLVSTAALVQGSAAFVETVQAYFNWEPASVLADDNATIISATGGGNWLRGSQANVPQYLTQTAWFIDRGNVTGLATDENSGLTAASPLLHKAEYLRRVGGSGGSAAPVVSASTTIKFLSAGTLAQEQADSLYWSPQIGEGATVLLDGPDLGSAGTPVAFTGTLLAVTAKNTGLGGTPLESTFTVTTGAVAAGMLLVNTTRGSSVSFAVANLAGTWVLQQPTTPFVVPVTGLPVEVDTWANGDAIVGYVLPVIGFGNVSVTRGSFGTGFSAIITRNLSLGGNDIIQWSGGILAGQCSIPSTSRAFFLPCLPSGSNTFYSCFVASPFLEMFGGTLLACSFVASVLFRDFSFSLDTLFHGGGTYALTGLDTVANSTGPFCIDAGTTLRMFGYVSLSSPTIYGGGTIDNRGIVRGTAPTYNCGALLLNGVATGYSMATVAGVTTIHGGIALSQANIVAAAGAAGFGGTATNLAGCAYTNAGAQP